VGYACGTDTFFNNTVVNHIVGQICLIPLMLPFEAWYTPPPSLYVVIFVAPLFRGRSSSGLAIYVVVPRGGLTVAVAALSRRREELTQQKETVCAKVQNYLSCSHFWWCSSFWQGITAHIEALFSLKVRS